MGRRLILSLTVALIVVGYVVRQALAAPDSEVPAPAAPAPAPPEPTNLPPPEVPPPDAAGKEKEPETPAADVPPAPLPGLPAMPLEQEAGPPATGREPPPPSEPAPPAEPPAPRPLPAESQAPLKPRARPLSAEPLPPAEALPPPALLDMKIKPAQAPGAIPKDASPLAPEHNPLPPAANPPGAVPATPAGNAGAARGDDGFVLRPDQLHPGRQAIALAVDVVGPATLNINQPATLKIVVKNTGATDVRNVVVRDVLPENLAFESSQPEAQRDGSLLIWKLSTVPADTERTILVRVKPTKVGAFDHAATVSILAGGKSQTIVREPKLKVEQTATTGKVLKGQQVQFKITISNPGDGPARKVVVQAKLSPGLRHESESGAPTDRTPLFEQTIDLLGPGQRVVLDTLVADTVLGGPQSCLVVVESPDVTPGLDDAKSLATVTVVEPRLRIAVAGPKTRFTDTLATYTITLENPGTSTARNVQVLATLPVSGQLASIPPGAKWNKTTGRLSWLVPQIEPGEKEKVTLAFQVKMGGVGFYQVDVESRGEGGLFEKGTCRTDVTGFADVVFDVSERRRSVDIDDETYFQIRIKNLGTKDATRLLIRAKISDNLDVTQAITGTDEQAHFLSKTQHDVLVFPLVDRLAPNKELILRVKVVAKKAGLATCRVYLRHDEMEAEVDDVAYTRVTTINRQ